MSLMEALKEPYLIKAAIYTAFQNTGGIGPPQPCLHHSSLLARPICRPQLDMCTSLLNPSSEADEVNEVCAYSLHLNLSQTGCGKGCTPAGWFRPAGGGWASPAVVDYWLTMLGYNGGGCTQ